MMTCVVQLLTNFHLFSATIQHLEILGDLLIAQLPGQLWDLQLYVESEPWGGDLIVGYVDKLGLQYSLNSISKHRLPHNQDVQELFRNAQIDDDHWAVGKASLGARFPTHIISLPPWIFHVPIVVNQGLMNDPWQTIRLGHQINTPT